MCLNTSFGCGLRHTQRETFVRKYGKDLFVLVGVYFPFSYNSFVLYTYIYLYIYNTYIEGTQEQL